MRMSHARILFQGSHKPSAHNRKDTPEQLRIAQPIAQALGSTLIKEGFTVVFTGARPLEAEFGRAAMDTCLALNVEPRERIRTYQYGHLRGEPRGFGMVLEPLDRRWQEVRTFIVQETDAVIGLIGGKGTSDVIQKAALARKPVFPIAVAGGGAQLEWERLKRERHYNRIEGDLDFLADRSMSPKEMATEIAERCKILLTSESANYSRRVFIVHGHDSGLKNELARCLERLNFTPVILHEQPDRGKAIIGKLRSELPDVGFAFILLTPDDIGADASNSKELNNRARQNVVFEHGLLVGYLGPDRVCAIVKGSVEIPSDLSGVLYKGIPASGDLQYVVMSLVRELRAAGYDVDANKLFEGSHHCDPRQNAQ